MDYLIPYYIYMYLRILIVMFSGYRNSFTGITCDSLFSSILSLGLRYFPTNCL